MERTGLVFLVTAMCLAVVPIVTVLPTSSSVQSDLETRNMIVSRETAPRGHNHWELDDSHHDRLGMSESITLELKPNDQVFREYLAYKNASETATSEDMLRELPIRYYVYPEMKISQKEHTWRKWLLTARYGTEADYELEILEALEKHPLRTDNASLADLFVIPTPVTQVLLHPKASSGYAEAFGALTTHAIWNQTRGNRHVMLALAMVVFDNKKAKFVRELSEWYPKLRNVTVAKNCDDVASYNLLLNDNVKSRGFERIFDERFPVTRSSFSIGLGISKTIPYHAATTQKFYNSSFLIFYRTRAEPSQKNSTPYRHAPLNINLEDCQLEPSSIGLDLPEEEWLQHFSTSKFCPVIRGDSPHSHALLRAIKVGCIPVIISNLYKEYSSPFRSSLNMEDYSVMIDEEDFLADPGRELAKLKDLSTQEIAKKIDNLAFAQKLVLPDHPDSLLVPAFLRETMESIRRGNPKEDRRNLPRKRDQMKASRQ